MDEKTIKMRSRAIGRDMRASGLDCLVVVSEENVRYVTGFTGDDSWVVFAGRTAYLVTDSRYTEQAEQECAGCRIIDRKGTMIKAVAKIIAKYQNAKTVGIEDGCPVGTYKKLQRAVKRKVKPVSGIIEKIREYKEPAEINAISKAAKIAWAALSQLLNQLRAGMSESEAAGLLDFNIRKAGSTNGFETIMAFGANGSRPHHQPGRRKLRTNDTILVDFGATYKGYLCDMTRCFVFGKGPAVYHKIYYAVLEAQQAAIKTVRDGVKMTAVDSAAREVLAKYDLPVYGHGTGHGLGLVVHETPYITKVNKDKLKAGQVITIEPGVYMPGKFGIRIEDDILVTKTGYRILSKDNLLGFSSPKIKILKSR
jgi:Xaa-Pro aminopeptidase